MAKYTMVRMNTSDYAILKKAGRILHNKLKDRRAHYSMSGVIGIIAEDYIEMQKGAT